MSVLKQKYTPLLLVVFLTFAVLLRFYNLNWGSPFYFHPDERNIASAITQLSFPNQMNPHFFAYGSLPIYAIYFTGMLVNYFSFCSHTFSACHVSFEQAIVISRIYSAIFSLLLIPLLFFIGKKILDQSTGLLASFFAVFSVGFIQFSHFGTFEMWLTFFGLLYFFFCIQLLAKQKIIYTILCALLFGILLASKVSSLLLFPIYLLSLLSACIYLYRMKREKMRFFVFSLMNLLSFLLITISVYICTNPFVLLDYQSFRNSINYESSVVLGTLPVFYTGEFYQSVPILFQFTHIFPFLINPLLTIIFIPSFFYICYIALRKKNIYFYMLVISFFLLFLPQAIFFAKWTRYMLPTLPFMYLIIATAFTSLKKNIEKKYIYIDSLLFICFITLLFSFAYFITAFIQEDTRVAAAKWAGNNIPDNANILSEVYDMGIVPFNSHSSNIVLFNFYDLDNNSVDATYENLQNKLHSNQYIILPSQRILKVRLQNKEKFPIGNKFYSQLTTGILGYTKIYESACDIWCSLVYFGNPIFNFEETANVFDRPIIMIYKKQ